MKSEMTVNTPKPRVGLGSIVSHTLLIIVALIVLFPFLGML